MKVSKEFKVGLLAVVSITILYLGFNFLKGIDFFSSSNQYYAIYDEIDGLNVSNEVILNGLAVGRVSAIRIMPNSNNRILVELDVNSKIQLGENSTALLMNSDFLGSKAIELLVEESIENPIEDGDTLLSELDKGLTDVLLESAGPVADDLGTTVRRINLILENLSANTQKIDNTLANLEQSSLILRNTMQENQNDIGSVLDNYNTVAVELANTVREVPPLLNKTTQFIDSLQTLELSETLQTVQQAVSSLNQTMMKIDQGDGTLARLINNDSLYLNLNKAAEDLDKLLVDLKENPNRYVHFSVFGRKSNSSDD
ncbi:MAG: MlaD family protein [Candidatus Cyclobacteriaceae bacterium M3_2C_046]